MYSIWHQRIDATYTLRKLWFDKWTTKWSEAGGGASGAMSAVIAEKPESRVANPFAKGDGADHEVVDTTTGTPGGGGGRRR